MKLKNAVKHCIIITLAGIILASLPGCDVSVNINYDKNTTAMEGLKW